MSKFVNISRYLYAILSGIPIGLILLFFGINGVSLDENDLHKKTGIVKELRLKDNVVYLKLNNEPSYYHTAIPVQVRIIEEKINTGDKVTVYKIKDNSGICYIEKLTKNGETLIEFKNALLVPVISLILGIIIVAAGIVYLIRNFSDLFGGDKEKMEDIIDPWSKYKD